MQRLSEVSKTVIGEREIDDPLAYEPPKLVNFEWDGGNLTLILDRDVSPMWVQALCRMDNTTSVLGKGPETFTFRGNKAVVIAADFEIQNIINYFKSWLPAATQKLKFLLERAIQGEQAERKDRLRRERDAEERKLKVMRSVTI